MKQNIIKVNKIYNKDMAVRLVLSIGRHGGCTCLSIPSEVNSGVSSVKGIKLGHNNKHWMGSRQADTKHSMFGAERTYRK